MSTDLDARVVALAIGQHGAFSRRQLLEAGITQRAIDHRLDVGRWERAHPGVYRIAGRPPTWLDRLGAAVLARPGSLVSHESAGALHAMAYVPRDVLSISAPRSSRPLPGINVHRPGRLFPERSITISGLPVTSRAATVIDLAAVLGASRTERLLDDQLSSHRLELPTLIEAFELQARRGKKGIALARRLIEARLDGLVASESELEHRFREQIAPALPVSPVYQFQPRWRGEGIARVDVAFPAQLLLVELDGRRWHLRDVDYENDRRRDQIALENGWRTARYTFRQISEETRWVIRNLRKILELGA